MYQLLEKKKSRFQPYVYSNFLFTGTKEKFFITSTDDIEGIVVLDIANATPHIQGCNDFVFVRINPQYPTKEFTLKLDLTNYLVNQMPLANFLVISNIENGKLLYMNYENNLEYMGGYDVSSNAILWQKENKNRFPLLISNGKVFSRDTINSFFYCESILTGERFWTFDLKSLPKYVHYDGDKTEEVTKVIGVFNKLVWFSTKGNLIIALDLENGELKHTIEWEVDESGISPVSDKAHLHSESGKIYLLSQDYYTIINASSGEIELKIKHEEFCPELFKYRRFITALRGDKICFMCNLKGPKQFVIGIFNIINSTLEWIYEMPLEKGAFLPASSIPLLSNDKLFILDSEETIYIFEKVK
jgi:outer membrane protein assembly factor BamB